MSSPAVPAPVSGIAPPRPPSTSPPPRSPPSVPPPPSEATGRSRTPPTTAATSPWAKIAPASAATQVSSPGSAASPSTSSRPTAEAPSPKIASAPPSAASITSSTFSASHSVERPWHLHAAAVLFVGDMLHPSGAASVQRLGDGDVGHRAGRRGAMPVPDPRRDRDNIARAHLLHRATVLLHPTAASSDDQGLAQRMRVPGRA